MRLLLSTILAIISLSVFAEGNYVGRLDNLSQPRFKLRFESSQVLQPTVNGVNANSSEHTRTSSYFVGNLRRYDATWLYPVSKSVGVNVDLGMNLHYFDGQVAVESSQGWVMHSYRSTIPMFYASALFDLPFKGLSARIDGGSQMNVQWDKLFTSFDYKASLRYDWDNGVGLEGGWQQRQWQLDNLGNGDNQIQSKGLYLDLKYQF